MLSGWLFIYEQCYEQFGLVRYAKVLDRFHLRVLFVLNINVKRVVRILKRMLCSDNYV